MIDISNKIETLRTARAQTIVKMKSSGIDLIKNDKVPKGNVLETARTAAYIAVKKTSELIPLCHPVPVEWINVNFEINNNQIKIECEVKTVYKTGCEMEALFGASCAGLCIYDMMKPIDKEIEIVSTKLLEKKGGKSNYIDKISKSLKAGVIVISDSVSKGEKQDRSGKKISEKLKSYNIDLESYEIIPDDVKKIKSCVRKLVKNKIDLIITTGGTGLSKRDVTPEAIKTILDREIPGVMEAAREYGQKRTPYSMLSRGIAGTIGETLILALPGSSRGAEETMDALFPYVTHLFRVMKSGGHNN